MEWKVGDGSLVKFWKDKAIKAFNRALVIKWKWLMFHQPDQLWSRILISKYKGWRGLEEGSHKQTHSFWWSDLKSIMHHSSMAEVLKQFHWKLGSGDQILFWEDSWVGDGITLREKYPELYQISSQKFQLVGSMGSFGEEGWQWEFSWRRNLFDNELGSASDFIEQVTALSPNAALKDYWVWGADPKGIFTTSTAYLCIKGHQHNLHQSPSPSTSPNKNDMEVKDDDYRDLAKELGVFFADDKSSGTKLKTDMDNTENSPKSAAVLGNEDNAS